jgi:hypothetical protein
MQVCKGMARIRHTGRVLFSRIQAQKAGNRTCAPTQKVLHGVSAPRQEGAGIPAQTAGIPPKPTHLSKCQQTNKWNGRMASCQRPPRPPPRGHRTEKGRVSLLHTGASLLLPVVQGFIEYACLQPPSNSRTVETKAEQGVQHPERGICRQKTAHLPPGPRTTRQNRCPAQQHLQNEYLLVE